ncbi:hypothetical protein LIER_44145 [Lithospermum erythrorhizon]|uniref:Uncharacterized protein n=1 Tax=Lithospermum erythrorhizon TaxID=34254 RepID=A0AAV3QKV5_LITER
MRRRDNVLPVLLNEEARQLAMNNPMHHNIEASAPFLRDKPMEFIPTWGNVRAISVLIPGSSNEDVPGELNRAFCRVRPRKTLLSAGSQRGRSDPKRLSYPSLVLVIGMRIKRLFA